MNREEHTNMLQLMLSAPGDLSILSANAAALTEDYSAILAAAALAAERIIALEKANSDLVKQNMEFFQKIAVPAEVEAQIKEDEMTFDKLFDESGNLK